MKKIAVLASAVSVVLLAALGATAGEWELRQPLVGQLGPVSETSPRSNAPATPASGPKKAPILRLDQLEASAFARLYDLKKSDGWDLDSGEFNQTYTVEHFPDLIIEAWTRKKQIAGIGFRFVGHSSLTDQDRTFIRDFLRDLDPGTLPDPDLTTYLGSAGDRPVAQILQVSPMRFGGFTVYAGSVGGDATISLERK